MGTIVAIESDNGVAIAGDERPIREWIVTGESASRILNIDEVGAGVVGDVGNVEGFQRRFEPALQEAEHDREIDNEVWAGLPPG